MPKHQPALYKQARKELSAIGISLLWTPWTEEYRVSFMRGTIQERQDRAYYTNDLTDALNTGRVMAMVQLPSEVKEAVHA